MNLPRKSREKVSTGPKINFQEEVGEVAVEDPDFQLFEHPLSTIKGLKMAENSSDKSQDDNSEVSEFKDESFGVNVGKLAGDLAKHSDRETASNVDKQNQEPKAEVAEIAELDVSTEANNRQLAQFIDRHGFIYTILCPPIATWTNGRIPQKCGPEKAEPTGPSLGPLAQ